MAARRSTIDTLPKPLLKALERAIGDRKATIDELVELVDRAGHQVSRSAMGRHRKVTVDRLAAFRETQEIAGNWMRQWKAEPEGDIGRMLGEMLKVIVFQTQMNLKDDEKDVDPKSLSLLARTIKDLGQNDRVKDELDERAQKRANARAADTAAGVAREAGLSEDRIAQIRRDVLGLRPEKQKEAAA